MTSVDGVSALCLQSAMFESNGQKHFFKNEDLTSTNCSEKCVTLDSRNGLWETSSYRNGVQAIINQGEEYSEERDHSFTWQRFYRMFYTNEFPS